jgi:hypothetical protein
MLVPRAVRPRSVAHLAIAALLLATALVVTGTPASAYGPLNIRFATVATTTSAHCARVAGTTGSQALAIIEQSNGCRLNDPFDDTVFLWDTGGEAMKVEFRNAGAYVAKFEFHPADETLWIYDTANDGDTIYVLVNIADSSGEPQDAIGPLGVTGTSAVVDLRVEDLAIPEGWQVLFHFFDDAAGNVPLPESTHATA